MFPYTTTHQNVETYMPTHQLHPGHSALHIGKNAVKHRAEAREKKRRFAASKVAVPPLLSIPAPLPVGLIPNTDAGEPGVVMPVPVGVVPVVGVVGVPVGVTVVGVVGVPVVGVVGGVPLVGVPVGVPVVGVPLNKTEQNHVNIMHSDFEVHRKINANRIGYKLLIKK